jgi:putative hydrolase of the HAD superfamily
MTAAPLAFGFDLGETLLTYAGTPLNWAELYPAALARVADAIGGSFVLTPAHTEEACLRLRAANTRLHPRSAEIRAETLFADILQTWGCPAEIAETHAAVAAFFGFFQQRMIAYPESGAALAALRTDGRRIGVLTDVPYGMPREFVQHDLDGAGLTGFVDVLLSSEETGWRKPAAAGFLILAARLGVPPSALWYVGNEEKDIRGATGAGLTAVLIDREHRRPDWGQHHTIGDLRELLAFTKSARAGMRAKRPE